MKKVVHDQNEFLLIEGKSEPQVDAQGNKIPNPNFGQTFETETDDPPRVRPSLTRRRFDDVFASTIGEVEYDDILELMATIAATTPKTEQSVQIKRALRALDDVGEIDFPIGDWKNTPDPNDLTAKFLTVVIAVCSGSVPDIADKIDAGLEAWPSIMVLG